jgi:hypothetical protein
MIIKQGDDFVIMMRAAGKSLLGRPQEVCCAIVGPGLAPEGILFNSFDAAVARGRQIAEASRVSLWDATAIGPAVLIATFRR